MHDSVFARVLSIAAMLALALACGNDDSDSGESSPSTSQASGSSETTNPNDGPGTTAQEPGDDSSSGNGSSAAADGPSSSTSAGSGTAGSYEPCMTTVDCTVPGEECLGFPTAPTQLQCRAPCVDDSSCPPDPGTINGGAFGVCARDGYCGVYCAVGIGECDFSDYQCARFMPGGGDGICVPE